VRLVLVSMLLMLATPHAEACPGGGVCVAAVTRAVAETPRAVAAPGSIDLAVRSVPSVDMLGRHLRTHVVPRTHAIEMPWIWQALRKGVYERMPRYESATADRRFSMMLSPVVVSSPQDTVPGVGVEGGF
jgi:hypothetical protein